MKANGGVAARLTRAVPHYFASWRDFEPKMFRTASEATRLCYAAA
jgi:hypothetical protein